MGNWNWYNVIAPSMVKSTFLERVVPISKQCAWLDDKQGHYFTRQLYTRRLVRKESKAIIGYIEGFPSFSVERESRYCRHFCEEFDKNKNHTSSPQ